MKRTFRALVALVILTACASKEPPHDGGSDAGSRDAGDAATADASQEVDADAGLDAGGWDGRELPPLEWDLPECTKAHGVLDRQIDIDGDPSSYAPSIKDLAAGGGTAMIRYNSRRVARLENGEMVALEPPAGYTELSPSLMGVYGPELRASAYIQREGEEERQQAHVSMGAGETHVVPWRDSRFSVWEYGNEVDAAGNWHFLGTPRGGDFEPGIHDMLVDPELNVTRSTLIASTASGWPAFGLEAKYVELARSDAGSMLLHQDHRERPDTLSVVPYDETGARPTVRWEDPLLSQGFDIIERFDAAADGDVVALQYSLVHYHGAYIERYGEVALDTGAVLRGPEPFGETGAFWDLELLTAPGGGIDVVQLAASVADNPRELANRGKPLHVYLGLPRPLRLENHTPLRVGAGAFAVHFLARRDGDRLVIAWRERGPEAGNRTAQGIYWAVLQCDP